MNSGKTSFFPGETAYILIYKGSNVSIDKILTSAGSVVPATAGMVRKEEDIFFDDSNTATLPEPARPFQTRHHTH